MNNDIICINNGTIPAKNLPLSELKAAAATAGVWHFTNTTPYKEHLRLPYWNAYNTTYSDTTPYNTQ